LAKVPEAEQYQRVKRHLIEARKLGQEDMQSILLYISAALLYGDQMAQDPQITAALQKVKAMQLTMAQALAVFP
jgi:hypothetical protein